MTDHEAEIATLDQEATQLRARVKRLEAALRVIAEERDIGELFEAVDVAYEALQESSE